MRTNLDKIDNLNLHEFVFSSKVVHIMVYKGSKMAKSQLTGKIGIFFLIFDLTHLSAKVLAITT